MPTFSIQVEYNGEPFCGFARQPGQLTVQGELENALGLLFKRPVETTCAGRTDSGVHARGQIVSFDVDETELAGRSFETLERSMNALTDDAIIVSNWERREDGFSARFDAKAREYRYFIRADKLPSLFMNDFSWHVPKVLDIDAMRAAAEYLIGEHDFKSFCMAVSAEGRRTYRHIDSIEIFEEQVMDENLLVVKITGNAFLHSMVRAIVGSLVAVGKRQRMPEWMLDVLEARDRKAAGENAPAKGLVLWDVRY